MAERAFVSLGSNIEPEVNLPRAVRELRSLGRLLAVSAVYQNPAVGPAPQPDYLNAAALLETDLAPRALRDALRQVEGRLGRRRTADKYASRTIDLDLVLYGSRALREAGLSIPDPDLATRPHVAIPLAELDPNQRHPISGESLGLIAERLRAQGKLTPRPDVSGPVRRAAGLAGDESNA